MVEEL
jgi:hypothetical protein